jgi:hypothetical protein
MEAQEDAKARDDAAACAADPNCVTITGKKPKPLLVLAGQRTGRGSGQNVRESWLQDKTPEELEEMLKNEKDAQRRLKIIRHQKALKVLRSIQKGRTRGPGIRTWTPIFIFQFQIWRWECDSGIRQQCEA